MMSAIASLCSEHLAACPTFQTWVGATGADAAATASDAATRIIDTESSAAQTSSHAVLAPPDLDLSSDGLHVDGEAVVGCDILLLPDPSMLGDSGDVTTEALMAVKTSSGSLMAELRAWDDPRQLILRGVALSPPCVVAQGEAMEGWILVRLTWTWQVRL